MISSAIEIVELDGGKSEICREILESLPDWFGIPEAVDDYTAAVEGMPMLAGRVDGRVVGFLSLKFHTAAAAEAFVLAVRRDWHRRGVGRALFAAAEKLAAMRGVKFLTVKTVASGDDPHYGATRLFYQSIGFLPIEIFPTLWDERDPCLLMLKPLGAIYGRASTRAIGRP